MYVQDREKCPAIIRKRVFWALKTVCHLDILGRDSYEVLISMTDLKLCILVSRFRYKSNVYQV